MPANQNVIDEICVKLTLDADQYKKADKQVTTLVDGTEKKMQAVDTKRKRRDTDQIKRNKALTQGVKELALGMRGLAVTIGSMLGVGSAAGLVATVAAFAKYETGLNRATVATGLSNRELQSYGATMRRLGADADAGAQAIAALAKEQQTFRYTGSAPTMQAFARIGVRVGPNTAPVDALAQAQQIYRQAAPAQKNQIESGLAAQGVSSDLIVAIKSETDVREAYTRSLAESVDANSKTMNALNDAMSSLTNSALAIANALANGLRPYIEQLGDWAHTAATEVSAFGDDVAAAGGGVEGFSKALGERSPEIAHTLDMLGTALRTLGEAVDLSAYGLQLLGGLLKQAGQWLFSKLGTGQENVKKIGGAFSTIVDAVKWAWSTAVPEARRNGPDIVGGMVGDHGGAARLTAPRRGGAGGGAGARPTMNDLVQYLVSRGMPPNEAIGIAANAQGESSLDPTNVNKKSGAAGLMQWLSQDRVAAFVGRYGTTPDKAPWQTQMDFIMDDPGERKRLVNAVFGASTAQQYGEAISKRFEAHGNIAEDMRRGQFAQQFASSYPGGSSQAGIGQQINLNGPVTVQANTPQEFVGSISRVSGVQNFNSAVR
ncbi:phage tail tip lysozyme [Paraburkholderia nemoris]|uniref:phage tail tip lysozyme n=1 Tax=Paraburkholderia nemoris TaxID=2793076 RepID=UPI0038BDF5A6